jgi:hypothetical protein
MQLSWLLPENLGSNALDTTKNKQIGIRVEDIQIYLLFLLMGWMILCWLACMDACRVISLGSHGNTSIAMVAHVGARPSDSNIDCIFVIDVFIAGSNFVFVDGEVSTSDAARDTVGVARAATNVTSPLLIVAMCIMPQVMSGAPLELLVVVHGAPSNLPQACSRQSPWSYTTRQVSSVLVPYQLSPCCLDSI